MKVYWVLGYDQYYPGRDNFNESFETYEEAEAYVEREKTKDYPRDYYDIINISDRLWGDFFLDNSFVVIYKE